MSSVLSEKLSRQLRGAVSRYDELPDWIKLNAPIQASGYSSSKRATSALQQTANEQVVRKKK